MNKVAIVYWSGTGNTQAMAEAVAQGVRDRNGECTVLTADAFSADLCDSFDVLAFGCPAMGAEILEESEFEPMFAECEPKLKGKKLALFGSYGWGDGEWMRDWEQRCLSDGAALICDSVICCETPDDDVLAACRALGGACLEQ